QRLGRSQPQPAEVLCNLRLASANMKRVLVTLRFASHAREHLLQTRSFGRWLLGSQAPAGLLHRLDPRLALPRHPLEPQPHGRNVPVEAQEDISPDDKGSPPATRAVEPRGPADGVPGPALSIETHGRQGNTVEPRVRAPGIEGLRVELVEAQLGVHQRPGMAL